MVLQTQLENTKQANEEEVKRNAPVLFLVSMTSSLLAYARGKITTPDMLRATCLFGCTKEHVINESGLWPIEATWLNKERKHNYGYGENNHLVGPDAVDPEFREKITNFIRVVESLDSRDSSRVFWRCEWYTLLINFHPSDTCGVFWNHTWQSVGKLREKCRPLENKPG